MNRLDDALAADVAGVGGSPDVDWAATYVARRDRLYGLALVILRESNDASDAVQSAFEKALRHRGRLLVGVPPEAWLARITCNEAISLARRRRIRRWVAFVARWLLACITLARSCARFWTNIGMIDEGTNHDRDH
jgi:DNA-directed RNA polymerase specialized sigma24 family protein